MEEDTLEELCELAKGPCKITWSDEHTEGLVKRMVENAVPALQHKLGMVNSLPEVFLKPGLTRTIFENYCMYDWNDMLCEFDANYKRDILTERHRYEVENGKKKSEQLQ